MAKTILLIDMDGVLCDWYGHLLRLYTDKYPNRSVVEKSEVTQFYVEELYPEEYRSDLMAISKAKGFYASLPSMVGAIDALKDIEENCLDFIEPFICTAPELESEDLMCHSEKAQWVQKHLGEFWTKRTIITKDKTLVIGHILIDDKPVITGVNIPVWEQIHYSQPYTPKSKKDMAFTWQHWSGLKETLKVRHERVLS